MISSGILLSVFAFESVTAFVSLIVGFLVIVGGVSLLFSYNNKMNRKEAKRSRNEEDKKGLLLGDDGQKIVEEVDFVEVGNI